MPRRDYPYALKRRTEALIAALTTLVERDPEQEIHDLAAVAYDRVLALARQDYPDDPLLQGMPATAFELADTDRPMRVCDALIVAHQIDAVIGGRPPVVA